MKKKVFKGVIFDLDGTLLDTIADIADAVNRTLLESGFNEHPLAAYHYYIGSGWRKLIYETLPKGTPEKIAEAVYKKSKTRYHDNLNKTTVPYSGITELLDYLAQQKIVAAVLTNKAHEPAVKCIKEILPDRTFAFIMGKGRDFNPKPDPEGALIISEKTGIPPKKFLFIGDSDVDMITANAAGMFGVGACWGYRDEVELKESGSKVLAYHPKDVIKFLSC